MTKGQTTHPFTRRQFLETGILGATVVGLSSTLVGQYACTSNRDKMVYGACYHDCPDCCSWEVTVNQGQVTQFQASTSNPFTAGKLCNKMDKFPLEVTYHPSRILTPLKRTGPKGSGEFTPISWEQGLKEVAAKVQENINAFGAQSVLPFGYAGTEGLIQNGAMSARFFARLGASKLGRTICGEAAATGTGAVLGCTTGVLPQDCVHARYLILWGTNTINSNQHLWPLVQQARQQGAKLVVIDPYRSRTAQEADWHIQTRPGTDVLLALSLIQVLLEERLYDEEYLRNYTTGWESLTTYVRDYAPEQVSPTVGLTADTIRTLAREYAQGNPSLIRVLIGMEHQANGASAFQAIAMLPAITGAWRHLGGGLLHYTYELAGQALNWDRLALDGTLGDPNVREISMIQIGQSLNDNELAPPIKTLFVYNANPAVTAPNQNLVLQGLRREDLFTVVLEHFITDTARYADYIFPATTQLEHWDLMTSWGQDYINLNEPAIPPLGEAKSNSDFFRLLAKELGWTEDYFQETDEDIIRSAFNTDHPFLKGITFKSLRQKGWARLNLPQPWIPFKEGHFPTESGKCQLFPPDGVTLPVYQPVEHAAEELESFPLQMMAIKSTSHFLNSSHANAERLIEAEGAPHLDIHPDDAASRQISDGETVLVFNQRGDLQLTARIGDNVLPGVVSMPQGYWSSLLPGKSSANALTTDRFTDRGHGAALQETWVQVQKIG
ncbi:MAG: molybdopterin-dependent oxidoreductase [Saprospiraceae bacterium]|nr:molybdopterin-dependent oxidoreductase [Saprospiraceae bacterium]